MAGGPGPTIGIELLLLLRAKREGKIKQALIHLELVTEFMSLITGLLFIVAWIASINGSLWVALEEKWIPNWMGFIFFFFVRVAIYWFTYTGLWREGTTGFF